MKKVRREEARQQRAAVAGYDIVFAPVKSAAVLWALDSRSWVRDAVRDAHDEAKDSALRLLEEHAALTRTGTGGVAQVETHGLIAAAFDHYDSRSGDPNLHTHVTIANKVCGVDGKWRALDGRALYRIVVAASEHYNSAFETALSARLKVRFAPRRDTAGGREPVREIVGVPDDVIQLFSRRRAAIETRYDELVRDYRRNHGHDPAAATAHQLARQANLDTRDGKKAPQSLAAMRRDWVVRAGPKTVRTVMSAVGDGQPGKPKPVDTAELARLAVAGVAERRSTWTVWNLRAEVERIIRDKALFATLADQRRTIDEIVQRAVSPEMTIVVSAPAVVDEPAGLRRTSGDSIFVEHASTRYTSLQVLDAERRLLAAAQTVTSSMFPPDPLDLLPTDLDAGQRRLVTTFAEDPRLLVVGLGAAGTGKTTAMRAFRQAVETAGRRVVPLASSAAAAAVLGHDIGVRAENVHKFLTDLRTQPDGGLARSVGPGDMILVDEAGMVGTVNLDALVAFAVSRGALVRLLGDYRQLGAVESGGALRLIAHDIGAVELDAVHRFHDPTEAAATLELRDGDSGAVRYYLDRNRITGGSRQAMMDAAYEGWQADMRSSKLTLMIAATNTDAAALAARARVDRVAAGQVERDGLRLHDGNIAGRGDWIVTRLNQRRLTVNGGRDFVKNGDPWQVIKRHRDGRLRVQHLVHGGRVTLPAQYAVNEVELLYAVTTHRAQGATVDTSHVLVTEEMAREHLYVAATRARLSTRLYVATHDVLPVDEDHRLDRTEWDPDALAACEVLEQIIGREGAERSATELIREEQRMAGSLTTLVPRLQFAVEKAAVQQYATLVRMLAGPQAADDTAVGALHRALRRGEDDGWDPGVLLRQVISERETNSAESVAQVLAWRIDALLDSDARRWHRAADDRSVLPWVRVPDSVRHGELGAYIAEVEIAIQNRVEELARTAELEQPAWLTVFGASPSDTTDRERWLRRVGVVAAYRDNYQVTGDEAERPLGPYVEEGRAGHRAYWHGVAAILGEPQSIDLHPAAADVFRSLAADDQAAVRTEMARAISPLPVLGDDVTRMEYADHLAQALRRAGHRISDADAGGPWRTADPVRERIRTAKAAEREAYRERLAVGSRRRHIEQPRKKERPTNIDERIVQQLPPPMTRGQQHLPGPVPRL
ncbi:MobF family relaxase [Hamadaea sp. NPDC051192]|uniref:MobF family relaxase n=1 Tax=Hamadaea sp. NPDC051192 TaxID=3154940 RepID=UPI003431548A